MKITQIEGLTAPGFSSGHLEDGEHDLKIVRELIEWIPNVFEKSDKYNKWDSSYGLKHFAERNIDKYVANGDFILAMINCDFEYKLTHSESPNVYFKIRKDYVKRLMQKLIRNSKTEKELLSLVVNGKSVCNYNNAQYHGLQTLISRKKKELRNK